MEIQNITLNQLPVGYKCKVKKLDVSGLDRRRILDLGVINDTIIESLHRSPSGDPIAYLIRGAVIALRKEISSQIVVELI